MALPKKNKAAAVLRKQAHIEKRRAEGTSLNAIRKELIADGMPKMSRAYFNEIVSEISMNRSKTVASRSAAQPVTSNNSSAQIAAQPAQQTDTVETMPRPVPTGGNFVDDRFDNDL
jgi:hypothetical protein